MATPFLVKLACNTGTHGATATSLIELLVAVAISGILFSGAIVGYQQASLRAEWSAYSLAAHSLALQRLEQTRACQWDTLASPAIDELIAGNFPDQIDILDVPVTGTNFVYATNNVTITTISVDPPLRMIQVDCTWDLMEKGPFTNTIAVYRAPDQ